MGRIIVRGEHDFLKLRSLCLSGLGVGMVLPIIAWLVFIGLLEPERGQCGFGSSMGLVVVLLYGFFVLYPVLFIAFLSATWSRILGFGRPAVWGAATGTGLALALTLVEWLVGETEGVMMQSWRCNGPIGIILLYLSLAGCHAIAAIMVWLAIRGLRWLGGVRIKLQDGHTCPRCAYDLTGNMSLTCSECGRPFNQEELRPVRVKFGIGHIVFGGETVASSIGRVKTWAGLFGISLGFAYPFCVSFSSKWFGGLPYGLYSDSLDTAVWFLGGVAVFCVVFALVPIVFRSRIGDQLTAVLWGASLWIGSVLGVHAGHKVWEGWGAADGWGRGEFVVAGGIWRGATRLLDADGKPS